MLKYLRGKITINVLKQHVNKKEWGLTVYGIILHIGPVILGQCHNVRLILNVGQVWPTSFDGLSVKPKLSKKSFHYPS